MAVITRCWEAPGVETRLLGVGKNPAQVQGRTAGPGPVPTDARLIRSGVWQ
ncbi:MAG: hypothetical protein ACYCXT_08360 [Acidiferrobacteraceae bacterium]